MVYTIREVYKKSVDADAGDPEQSAVAITDSDVLEFEVDETEYQESSEEYPSEKRTVFIQNGSYMIPVSENTTVLLKNEDGFKQYVVNSAEIGQLDECTERIVYYTEDFTSAQAEGDGDDAEIKDDNPGEETSENWIGELLSDDSDNPEQAQGDTVRLQSIQPQYQYAILKDGKLHLQVLDYVDVLNPDQLATVENGNEQLQEQLAALQESINMEDSASSDPLGLTENVDLNRITGKNLITGQTVTLDGYLSERRKRTKRTKGVVKQRVAAELPEEKCHSKADDEVNDVNKEFINKRMVIGKTANGKTLIGKIIHIETNRKDDQDAETNPLPALIDKQTFLSNIMIKKHVITRESFDYNIGKILTGLMDLETIQKKVQDRNLLVKVVEKIYRESTKSYAKSTSFVYGHMELANAEENDWNGQRWNFILHNERNGAENISLEDEEMTSSSFKTKDDQTTEPPIDTVDLTEVSVEMDDESNQQDQTTLITLITTVEKNGKRTTKVNWHPFEIDISCGVCNQYFKSKALLKKHFNSVHMRNMPGVEQKCRLCDKVLGNYALMLRHMRRHVNKSTFTCSVCQRIFNTNSSLKRHITIHDPSLRPLECSVCNHRFIDESGLKRHLVIHTGIRAYRCNVCSRAFICQGDLNFHRRIHDPVKQYSCKICGREFSRHSNLVRHAEIHRRKDATHQCHVCGCSYSFISSLTRHIVQRHLKK